MLWRCDSRSWRKKLNRPWLSHRAVTQRRELLVPAVPKVQDSVEIRVPAPRTVSCHLQLLESKESNVVGNVIET